MLEREDKFLKASIGITNFDNLIRNYLRKSAVEETALNQKIADVWTDVRKGKADSTIFLEKEEIIAERLRAARKEPVTFRRDASGYLVEPDNHICTMLNPSGTCSVYDHRPLDCRSFPVVPRFSLSTDDVDFYLANAYCPLGKTPSLLPDGFVPDAQRMWRLLAPMIERSWKAEYNRKNAKAYTTLLPRVATERTRYGQASHISSSS